MRLGRLRRFAGNLLISPILFWNRSSRFDTKTMLESDTSLSLPYWTADLPGVGGTLRLTPEHFVVEEVPLYAAEGEGQHLFINLTKVGLTTKDVQRQLERLLGLRRDDVGYAGLKDKQARTTQTFSLTVERQDADQIEQLLQRIKT